MSLDEIEQSLKSSTTKEGKDTELVHIRFGPGYLDCKTSLVKEAIAQIKKNVALIEMRVVDAGGYRAEALLLMILNECYYHGYTPK